MTSAQIAPNIGDEAQRVIADNDNSVDGTSSGVVKKPPEASKAPGPAFQVSSYFEDDMTEGESPSFYKAVLQTVTPTSLILGFMRRTRPRSPRLSSPTPRCAGK